MTQLRILALLALIAGSLFAQEMTRIRFRNDVSRTGKLISWDHDGILFQPEGSIPLRFRWEQISEETILAIRGRPLQRATEPETPGEVPMAEVGIRVRSNDTDAQEILGREDATLSTEDFLVIRNASGLHRVARAEVRIDPAEVPMEVLYSPDEIYRRILSARTPRTADDHLQVGNQCARFRLTDKAAHHYGMYEILRQRESPEGRAYGFLDKIRADLEAQEAQEVLYQAGKLLQDEKYAETLQMLEKNRQKLAPADADLELLLNSLRVLRDRSQAERIVAYWEVSVEALLRTRAADRAIRFDQAFRYVTRELLDEAATHVSEHFGLSRESILLVWSDRPPSQPRTASYGDGTWLVEQPDLADAEAWWAGRSTKARFDVLRALHAEEHRRVFRVGHKGCRTCGGAGRDPRFTGPGVYCPDCLGLTHERYVLYR